MTALKKYSRKREAILAKIRSTKTHPSAVWVYEELRKDIPDISLGTVYRNLSVFREEGQIISVGFVNGQERFDGNTAEHTHFICTKCGDVLDIEADVPAELNASVARRNHIDVQSHQLTFYGLCAKCSHSSESAEK